MIKLTFLLTFNNSIELTMSMCYLICDLLSNESSYNNSLPSFNTETPYSRILHMISDIAEPSRASAWYPFMRYKDWFAGHGWASGLFAFADGKNQESTSESVMAWYSIYLWGMASENSRLRDLGRLMTALEIRTAHKYLFECC